MPEEDNKIQVYKLTGVKNLLRNSWNIYKKDFSKLMIISAVVFGVIGLISVFVAPEIEFPENVQTSPYGLFTLPLYWYIPVWILMVLLSVLGSAVLISAVKETPKEWQVKEAFKEGRSKFLPFLIASILVSLVVGVGFLLLIIPGIIFSVWLTFVSYTVICEDKRNFGALKRSKELVKGYWWQVLGRIICLSVIMVICSFLSQLIFQVFGAIVFSVLSSPFGVVYSYLIYKDLRRIKSETA